MRQPRAISECLSLISNDVSNGSRLAFSFKSSDDVSIRQRQGGRTARTKYNEKYSKFQSPHYRHYTQPLVSREISENRYRFCVCFISFHSSYIRLVHSARVVKLAFVVISMSSFMWFYSFIALEKKRTLETIFSLSWETHDKQTFTPSCCLQYLKDSVCYQGAFESNDTGHAGGSFNFQWLISWHFDSLLFRFTEVHRQVVNKLPLEAFCNTRLDVWSSIRTVIKT